MRFYEIYQGEELQATLIVHDDGRKEWDWIRHEWALYQHSCHQPQSKHTLPPSYTGSGGAAAR
jgi:hypothetical protein